MKFSTTTHPTILVTGGAGFVGSHAAKMLALEGYRPVVFDNLSMGNRQTILDAPFIQGDLSNTKDLDSVFKNFHIQAIMHFAAFIDVGESVANPAKYYINNVINTINLLEAMRRHDVKTLIFSSSAAIFGLPLHEKIDENHPCNPINPYGQSKLFVEKILQDYDAAYGIKSSCLRYFNAAGGDPEGKIKNYKRKETNLIPLILQSLKQPPENFITIFGTDYPTPDGTCIRDYIHIEDLGAAHILALKKLFADHRSSQYNLGNEQGFSVRQVITAVERVTNLKVNFINGPRRSGDPAVLVANAQKARKELGWTPQFSDLDTMIAHAWKAQQL